MKDTTNNKINEYYSKVYQNYDKYWYNKTDSEVLKRLLNNNFHDTLQLNENSLIIDYGGGSGVQSEFFFKCLNLKNKVLCIDPSPHMIQIATQKEGVIAQTFDPDSISITNNNIPQQYKQVDIVYLCGCFHFIKIKDIKRIFDLLNSLLKPNGIIVIQSRPDYIKHYPFPKMVLDTPFGQSEFLESYNQLQEDCQFESRVTFEKVLIEIEKQNWYQFLREKTMSNLANFTDEQIESGIKELEEKFKNDEILKFYEYQYAIVLKKSHQS